MYQVPDWFSNFSRQAIRIRVKLSPDYSLTSNLIISTCHLCRQAQSYLKWEPNNPTTDSVICHICHIYLISIIEWCDVTLYLLLHHSDLHCYKQSACHIQRLRMIFHYNSETPIKVRDSLWLRNFYQGYEEESILC